MAERSSLSGGGIEKLVQARKSLASILEKSQGIAEENAGSGSRRNLLQISGETLAEAKRRIRGAVRSGFVVLKIFDELRDLEPCLLADPLADLPGFLAALDLVEEIIRFLRDNCCLTIQELEESINYVGEISILDDRCISKLKSSVNSLKKSELELPFHGSLRIQVLDRLEIAFRRLLVAMGEDEEIPSSIIQNLIRILERISENGCLEGCSKIYAEVRASAAQTALRDFATKIEEHRITDWKKRLKFVVKHVFTEEYRLSREIFHRFEPNDFWMRCFAEIAIRGGVLSLLQFGTRIAKCGNDDPEKLFDLLEMFDFLIRLRLDFNRLFGMKSCAEIQIATRDLIKNIVKRSCKIFWELENQTAIVSTIECCNRLLGDDYRPILSQILAIDRSWRGENFYGDLLAEEILNLIVSLETNVEEQAESYEIPAERHVFKMNSHRHFYKHLKGTKLETLLGWQPVKEHNELANYYCLLYLRETWAKLPPLLIRRELVLISRGRAIAKDVIKKRLRSFNETLDDICRKHTFSLIADEDLWEKVCRNAVQIVVPVYRSFMQSYGPLVESDGRSGRYVKHTAEALENSIRSFFHLKPKLTEIYRCGEPRTWV